MIRDFQKRSRAEKLNLFYQTMTPTKDDEIVVLGSGDGSYFIDQYPFKDKITAVDHNIAFLNKIKEKHPEIKICKLDLNMPTPFKDNQFDIAFSNAVIEHIDEQQTFSAEIERISRKYFVSCPNKYFPFEMHYRLPLFQFFPEWLRRTLTKHFSLGNFPKGGYETIILLTPRQMKKFFPGGRVRTKFLGYNLIAYRQ